MPSVRIQTATPFRDVVVSPGFLLASLLLGLNDRVFKEWYGNWFTGKLSDVAGLFAFAVFLGALVPRHRIGVCVTVALAFVWWKSPLADPAIAAWNRWDLWPVQRVIDPTDLMALVMLPLAWWYGGVARVLRPAQSLRAVSSVAAIFLFAATSEAYDEHPDQTLYVLPTNREAFLTALRTLDSTENAFYAQIRPGGAVDTVLVDSDRPTSSTELAPVQFWLEVRTAMGGETVATLVDIRTPRRVWERLSVDELRRWLGDSVLAKADARR